jgi:arylsulfatase A-like enzyme
VLGVHLVLQAAVAPVQATSFRNASGKWIAEMLSGDVLTEDGSGLVPLLHAHTNIPRSTHVAAVDVNLAELTGSPASVRPHVFVFTVDSLRRDYLSPYNPEVTFTPGIESLAQDSMVFRNAFTQYGATGLSIPSIWVGGLILHKQYVTSFPRMNTLAKLLAHEQYEQWVGMDHIMETILPPSDRRVPLDPGVAVKDFRLCNTITQIRTRLGQRPPDAAPVFAFSLPQDIHVSVINREGARSIDDADYRGFYAPVASRIHRFDKCLGEFVSDLKARGLYDQSVIILTSDHGDSLGEEGRFGHAYSLHPEIVRVPLIVHVPPALRATWGWKDGQPVYTTDITPTLYRLLGHEPLPPSPFFGESLAHRPGAPPPARDRMVGASYGAVYGALLDDASRYYVFDAIAMREMAFEIGDGLHQRQVPVTADVQERGLKVIRDTVETIGTFYKFATAPGSGS